MKKWVFYDEQSGVITRYVTTHGSTPQGAGIPIDVTDMPTQDWSKCYVKDQVINAMPAKPDTGYYKFDLESENWVNDSEAEIRAQVAESYDYLAKTDWYYTRKAEIGDPIPEDVVANRTAARNFLREHGFRGNKGVDYGNY